MVVEARDSRESPHGRLQRAGERLGDVGLVAADQVLCSREDAGSAAGTIAAAAGEAAIAAISSFGGRDVSGERYHRVMNSRRSMPSWVKRS